MAEQDAGVPGILGGHQIDAAQSVQCSLGDIRQIADGVGTIYRVGMSLMGSPSVPTIVSPYWPVYTMENFNTGRGMNLNRVTKQLSVSRLFGIPTRGSPARRLCVGPNQPSDSPACRRPSRIDQECPVVSGAGGSPPSRRKPSSGR